MDSSPLRGYAIAFGAFGLTAMAAGIVVMIGGEDPTGTPLSGILIRSGAILAAVALVLPTIRKPALSTSLIAGSGLVLVLLRPGLFWVALLAWLGWLVFGRQRRTADRES